MLKFTCDAKISFTMSNSEFAAHVREITRSNADVFVVINNPLGDNPGTIRIIFTDSVGNKFQYAAEYTQVGVNSPLKIKNAKVTGTLLFGDQSMLERCLGDGPVAFFRKANGCTFSNIKAIQA